MTANILFDRIYQAQSGLCGTHWILLHNPMKLTSLEVQKEIVETRFIDYKTLAIRFASKQEGRRQAKLFFLRLLNKGGNLNDFLRRIKEEDKKKIITSLAPFYPFAVTGQTNVRELCDE